jgi:gp16 family phage-associated protein
MQVTASRQWFFDTGTTIAHWAAENGFSPDLAYAVISGRVKGTRGEAFRIRKKIAGLAAENANRGEQAPKSNLGVGATGASPVHSI